jgi:hypothetical protein
VSGGYILPSQVTKVRIFTELTYNEGLDDDSIQWTLDGIDGQGGYTEDVLSFDTWAEAIAAIPAFIASLGLL